MTRIALVRTVCKIKNKIKSLSKVSSPTLSLSLGDLVQFSVKARAPVVAKLDEMGFIQAWIQVVLCVL